MQAFKLKMNITALNRLGRRSGRRLGFFAALCLLILRANPFDEQSSNLAHVPVMILIPVFWTTRSIFSFGRAKYGHIEIRWRNGIPCNSNTNPFVQMIMSFLSLGTRYLGNLR